MIGPQPDRTSVVANTSEPTRTLAVGRIMGLEVVICCQLTKKPPGLGRLFDSFGARGLVAFAVHALAQELAVAAHSLGVLAGAALGRLLEIPTHLHLAVDAFALHLFLKRAQRLIDVVVFNLNFQATGSCARRLNMNMAALPGPPASKAGFLTQALGPWEGLERAKFCGFWPGQQVKTALLG